MSGDPHLSQAWITPHERSTCMAQQLCACFQGSRELKALQEGLVNPCTMQFIDFEYGSYNYRGFDFGNNWCEYAGLEGDYSRYPNDKQQAWFVTNYLQEQGHPAQVRTQT